MKKLLYLLLFPVAFAACKKKVDCPPVTVTAPPSEVAALKAYLDANSITATEDSRGFFYIIGAPGSGTHPGTCNSVTVNYTGRLTSGAVFDTNNGVNFPLANLILGWQEGIPLIGAGGSITLYLPPTLGYGSQAVGSIPANSNLIFTIDLLGVN